MEEELTPLMERGQGKHLFKDLPRIEIYRRQKVDISVVNRNPNCPPQKRELEFVFQEYAFI